ncbi:MAG: von Willebrand factor type A domain-containing protein, partial [Ruminococcus flavefaciens]|nr:von Willebrand factor type A domain-containing protein [Ruminococcus flavefaciens]
YSLVRNQINYGYKVDASGVRIEEMINYFDYGFPSPEDKSLAASAYLSDCPWNADNKLMLVGLKSTEMVLDSNANYVFLIDVSGSMSGDNRIGLAKKGLNMLLNQLGDKDLVSVVTYASGVSTVLDGGECTEKGKENIRNKISGLVASGSTNGGDGLRRAYDIAQKHFITGGNNRVIIISDGDFNVGMDSASELKEFIGQKAKSGVYLSVIGVGMGNMRDDFMETLALNGNGNYAYLDSETEARKVFVDELKGTLFTVAKDAKAGVTFTDAVEKYRLVGYDAKTISEDDFNNENADTGEIGSNLCVTALYEISLADGAEGKLADVEVRYKDVSGNTAVNESVKVTVDVSTPSSDDLAFISCVAEFGLILRNSEYKGSASLTAVLTRLNDLNEYIANDTYKKELVTLVGKASESKYYN